MFLEEGGMDDSHVARLGSSVLLDINNGDRLTFARLHPSATLKIGNTKCSLAPLIGSPYGAVFELQRGPKGPCLVQIPRFTEDIEAQASGEQLNQEAVADELDKVVNEAIERDNRALVDDNTAQKLSADDISRMRSEGISGKEIIEALIANSTTFQNKTIYSQEKYKRKKQKKYAPCLVLRCPSARRICETYFSKSPQKIGFLRMDMLGLMLSLANVGAHADVLVMDRVGGLLTAAVAERLGGFGSICTVYHTAKPFPMDIVGLLNLSDKMASRVLRASLRDISVACLMKAKNIPQSNMSDAATSAGTARELWKGCNGPEAPTSPHGDMLIAAAVEMSEMKDLQSEHTEESCASLEAEPNAASVFGCVEGSEQDLSKAVSGSQDGIATCVDEAVVADDYQCADRKEAVTNANKSVRAGRNATTEDILGWAKYGFTSLIVGAPDMDPWSVAQQLLPLLCSSSSFVIYHPYLQPLAECMHLLQMNRMAVALQISEPWLREYQVLPSRTHPHMLMSSTGGYALSGIKVVTA